jgi:hypothetical protein
MLGLRREARGMSGRIMLEEERVMGERLCRWVWR